VVELARIVGSEYALGAASWRAREWLGRPDTLTEGSPADLVIFDADPRRDLTTLARPRHVVLRGRLVQRRGSENAAEHRRTERE
jgi:imidazolonepropionase-like amidohydrolase